MAQDVFNQFYKKYESQLSQLGAGFSALSDPKISSFMDELMDLLDENNFAEANKLLIHSEELREVIVGNNPIFHLIWGRAYLGLSLTNEKKYVSNQELHQDAVCMFASTSTNLNQLCVNFLETFEDHDDPTVQKTYLQFFVMWQYALHLVLQLGRNGALDVSPWKPVWEMHGFDKLNNYTGVEPIIARMCPFHHIWKQYIYDGFVYQVSKEGVLEQTPIGEFDFSSQKNLTADPHHPCSNKHKH